VYLPETVPGTGVFLNHMFAARRLKPAELRARGFRDNDALANALGLADPPGAASAGDYLYIQLANDRGTPRPMDGIGALYHAWSAETYSNILARPADTDGNRENDVASALGLTPAYVLDWQAYSDPALPNAALAGQGVLTSTGRFASWTLPNAFPAHRFNSNGFLVAQSPKQRFDLPVGALPTFLPEEDRFVADYNLADPGRSFAQQMLAFNVEVFAALGRVKVRPEFGPVDPTGL